MSKKNTNRRAGILLIFLVAISAFSPLISTTSASDAIQLSLSEQHVLISPGTTTNLTLTIHNNDSQINDYNNISNSTIIHTIHRLHSMTLKAWCNRLKQMQNKEKILVAYYTCKYLQLD